MAENLGALPLIRPHTSPHGNDVIVFHPHWEVVILSGPTPTVAFDTANEPIAVAINLYQGALAMWAAFIHEWRFPPASEKSPAKSGAIGWHNEARWGQRSPGQGG